MNAFSRLEEAFNAPPANDLERDGCIQRFEYTYELCWKMMRRQLISMDVGDADLLGRRDLFREAARHGLIEDPELWFSFQRARNLSSHNYDADKAEETYVAAKAFVPRARKLYQCDIQIGPKDLLNFYCGKCRVYKQMVR